MTQRDGDIAILDMPKDHMAFADQLENIKREILNGLMLPAAILYGETPYKWHPPEDDLDDDDWRWTVI
jgi:hypothetical protein